MTSDLPMREIVATGLGVISPVGQGQGHNATSAYWQALLRGASGIRMLRGWDASQQPVQFGGEVIDFEPKLLIRPRKSLKVMSREIQTAVAAASLAMEDAGFLGPVDEIDPLRMGIVLGAEVLYADLGELADLFHHCVSDGDFRMPKFGEQFPLRVYPLWLLKYLPNMSACHISIAHNAQGPCNTVVSGDVSSLLAVLEAARVIQRGAADLMLTGGSGSRLIMTPFVFRGDCELSHRNDDPAAACRPFDLARDGVVNGEGSAVLVLEHREHAERRGAKILATFLGGAAAHATRPGRESKRAAVRQAIQRCLANAGVSPDQVCHVNAHGLSTPDSDVAESQGITDILAKVPVIAPKANFGNLGASSGAVEMAASIYGQMFGELPHHPNYREPDPLCTVNVVRQTRIASPGPWLKLGMAPSGQVVCLSFGP